MKIAKGRQILFFVSLIGIIVVTLIMGTTFAYQTLVVDYKEGSDNDLVVEAGKLNVSYENTNRINLTNMTLLPDYKTADYTEFTVYNKESTDSVGYKISLKDITYAESLINNGLKYTLVKVDEAGNNILLYEGDFKDINGNKYDLKTKYDNYYNYINKNEKQKIRLYLWLEETEANVNLKDTFFSGKIEITSLFYNEINEKLVSGFKVYGNSIQESDIDIFDEVNTVITNGYYLDQNGNEVSSTLWKITDYISVDGYDFSLKNIGGKTESICTYDINKNLLGCKNYNSGDPYDKATVSISSTTNISYIRFSIYNKWTHLDNIYLTENIEPNPDNPIQIKSLGSFDETTNKYKIPITVYGKNLANNYAVYESPSTIGSLTDAVITDEYIDVVRQHTYDYTYVPVELKANTAYSLYIYYEVYDRPSDATDSTVVRVGIGNKKSQKSYVENTTFSEVFNYTPTQNMKTNIELNANYGSKVPGKVRFKIMLVEGTYTKDTMPKYEAYKEPITTNLYLDEPLRKVGNYADYIDFETSKVVRKVGVKTFDGTETIGKGSNRYQMTYSNTLTINADASKGDNLCNYFPQGNSSKQYQGSEDNTATVFNYGEQSFISFAYSQAATSNDFKQFLKNKYDTGNPLKIQFQLINPREEYVDLSNIHLEENSSIYVKSDNGISGTHEINFIE